MQNLRRNPKYTFTNFTGDIPEGRFYLRMIDNSTSLDDIRENREFYMYADKCRINIYSEGDPVKQVRIYNLQGQQLDHVTAINEEMVSFDLKECREQILIVRIQTEKELISKKILVRP
ncbi:MAG: hypothetical protein LUG18_14130 [Candidatus Azobacteroides sp.]|nr:hypothetical protein [Candidatus Azobacteroides sp.]